MVNAISGIQKKDSLDINSKYPHWKYSLPLPPDSLMWSVGGANIENFLVVAEAWFTLISRYAPPNSNVLDIGCGCGRIARLLMSNKYVVNYIGFDVIKENIDWCNAFIKKEFETSSDFLHFDIHSEEYNPSGAIKCQDFSFPCEDGTVDIAFAASVFTHLFESDCIQYLKQTSRVLRDDGYAIFSIHTNSGEANFSGNETRIDIKKDYFLDLASTFSLSLVDYIDDFGGQQVCIFQKVNRI